MEIKRIIELAEKAGAFPVGYASSIILLVSESEPWNGLPR